MAFGRRDGQSLTPSAATTPPTITRIDRCLAIGQWPPVQRHGRWLQSIRRDGRTTIDRRRNDVVRRRCHGSGSFRRSRSCRTRPTSSRRIAIRAPPRPIFSMHFTPIQRIPDYSPLNPRIKANMTAAQITRHAGPMEIPQLRRPRRCGRRLRRGRLPEHVACVADRDASAQGRVRYGPAGIIRRRRFTTSRSNFLRLDLEDVPLPSFHRPDLVNYWHHRLLTYLTSPPINLDPEDAARGVLQPYGQNGYREGDPRDSPPDDPTASHFRTAI